MESLNGRSMESPRKIYPQVDSINGCPAQEFSIDFLSLSKVLSLVYVHKGRKKRKPKKKKKGNSLCGV